VSNSIHRKDNLISIDKGSTDGVKTDMGVACGNGLVGVVYLTSDHYSVVVPVLNHLSHISVTIRNRGYFGYLTWDGGSPVVAYVEDIPRHAQFKKGDWIETSGYSNIFPAGISVGKIVDIKDSDDGLSYRLKLNLSTDFSCLRDVCVITEQGFAERMQLHEAAVDSMKSRQ
jgi:rod shape-determining protein MreC